MARTDASHHESDPLLPRQEEWEGSQGCEERHPEAAPPVIGQILDEDDRTTAQRLAILVPYLSILVLFVIGGMMIDVPVMELSEAIICRSVFGDDIPDPADDPRCKQSAVQSELALINGWELTFGLIPSILVGVPFGLAADKHGRHPIMLLAVVGAVLSLLGVNIICLYPDTFPLRLRWLMPMFMLIGGGASTVQAMTYTVLADATPQAQRSTAFLYLMTLLTACALVASPLTYFSMNGRGALFTLWVGTAVVCLTIPIAMFLPESRSAAVVERAQAAHRTAETSRKADNYGSSWNAKSVMRATRDYLCLVNRTLFAGNPTVGILLLSTMFITVGKAVVILMLQYVTKRFGWSFAEAGLLLPIKSTSSMVITALALPALSQLLLRLGLTPLVKDTWILRVSAVISVVGLLAMGTAPTIPLFITAMVLNECGGGLQAALRSVVTELIEETHMALLMTVLSMSFTVSEMVAGPLMAQMFKVGIDLKGFWVGIPYFTSAAMLSVATVLVLCAPITRHVTNVAAP